MKRSFLLVFVVALSGSLILSSTLCFAAEKKITTSYAGCIDKAYYNKLSGYLAAGNKSAYTAAFAACSVVGKCTFFHKGETVSVESSSFFSGLVKLKRKGDPKLYWTSKKAIQ